MASENIMKKRRVALSALLIVVVLVVGYSIYRWSLIASNDLLKRYGGGNSNEFGHTVYESAAYGEVHESFLLTNPDMFLTLYQESDGASILVIQDLQHGFAKTYRNGVLQSVFDRQFRTILNKITFNTFDANHFYQVRTREECDSLATLLLSENYDEIERLGGKIVTTYDTTKYIN